MAHLRKIPQNKNNKKPISNNVLVRLDQQNKCELCNQYIREQDQQVVQYQKHSYHPKCFRCAKCRRSMRDITVYAEQQDEQLEKDDRQPQPTILYCEKCYLDMLDKCARCGKQIYDQIVTLGSKIKLHQQCFCCDVCGQRLDLYIEYKNKYFCQDCYLKECLPKCAKCDQALRLAADQQTVLQIIFASKYFHPECFVCDQCSGDLESEDISTNDANGGGVEMKFDQHNQLQNKQQQQNYTSTMTLSCTHEVDHDQHTNQQIAQSTKNQQQPPLINKIYYPVEGQKLCKNCALSRLQN